MQSDSKGHFEVNRLARLLKTVLLHLSYFYIPELKHCCIMFGSLIYNLNEHRFRLM